MAHLSWDRYGFGVSITQHPVSLMSGDLFSGCENIDKLRKGKHLYHILLYIGSISLTRKGQSHNVWVMLLSSSPGCVCACVL